MTAGQALYGVVMGLLALLGLTLAAGAKDAGFAWFGYALLAFGLVNVFILIHRATGAPEGGSQADRP